MVASVIAAINEPPMFLCGLMIDRRRHWKSPEGLYLSLLVSVSRGAGKRNLEFFEVDIVIQLGPLAQKGGFRPAI